MVYYSLTKLIPYMVRQVHHERNQPITVRPESFGYTQESLVEGHNRSLPQLKLIAG